MGWIRENTFEIDFSSLGRARPPAAVVHIWIKNNINIPVDSVDGLQLDNEKSKVYLKITTKQEFERLLQVIVKEYDFTDNAGKVWKIPVREVSEYTLVRVMGVSFETPMNVIEESLAEYGTIVSSEFERWGNGYEWSVRNGVRLFKMILSRPIPSYIRYADEEENYFHAQVMYTGQQRTCRICNSTAHFVRDCPRRRGNPRLQVSSYYKVVERHFPPLNPPADPPIVKYTASERMSSPPPRTEDEALEVDVTSENETESGRSSPATQGRRGKGWKRTAEHQLDLSSQNLIPSSQPTQSICVTVVVLNVHFRSPQTHTMAPWVKRVFIHILPRLLVMRRPQYTIDRRGLSHHRVMVRTCNGLELRDPTLYAETAAALHELGAPEHLAHLPRADLYPPPPMEHDYGPASVITWPFLRDYSMGSSQAEPLVAGCRIHGTPVHSAPPPMLPPPGDVATASSTPATESNVMLEDEHVGSPRRSAHHWHNCPELHKAIDGVRFIADHTKREEDSTRVKEDWKYVAMVLDRLFLWIFTLAVLVGTAGIILQAPTLYDDRIPIDVRLSEIASTTAKPHIATGL